MEESCEQDVCPYVSGKEVPDYPGAGIRLPAVFRDCLLACGGASLNRMMDRIQMPEPHGEPFQDYLTFSYAYIADELACNDPEDDTPEQKRLRALPRERWGEVVPDYLLICWENEGSWAERLAVKFPGRD